MKGREVPSDHQLRQNIERRMLALEEDPLSKRFNRQGVKKNARSTNRIGLAGAAHNSRSLQLKQKKGGNAGGYVYSSTIFLSRFYSISL